MEMMKGIYSLGSYIQTLVSESLKTNNLVDRTKFSIKEEKTKESKDYQDEYEDSDEIEDDENLDLVELDMSSPAPMMGRGQYSSKISKSTMSPGRRGRFMMSPFVKSIINNNLTSKKNIGLSKAIGLVMDECINGNLDDDVAQSPGPATLERTSSRAMYANSKNTVDFNKKFLKNQETLPLVQHMVTTHRKRWTEKRTVLVFNPENIHILIADDSVSQI